MEGVVNQATGKVTKLYYDLPEISTWRSLTRLILKKYPIQQVLYHLDEALLEAADEQWINKKYPKGFFKEDFEYPKRKSVKKVNLHNSKVNNIINENLKITEVAKSYGLDIKKSKAVCPFHIDTDPSLSFSDKKNLFNCFGCHVKGNIITFIKMMEEKRNDKYKRGSE